MNDALTIGRIDVESEERFLSLRRALGVGSVGINQLTLQPGQRGRIHRHREQEEIYLVLVGTLTLLVEGTEHELGPGALARVEPSARRQLVNAAGERCVIVAVGAADGYVGRDAEAFRSWDDAEALPPQEVELPPDLVR
jgi:uncharacterized cupin superfamily protein